MFPGILLVQFIKLPRLKDDFLIWWGCINISSLAFWAVVPWLTLIPGVRMTLLFHITVAICILIMFLRPVRVVVPDKTSFFQLALILALFGIPFVTRIAFGSGDMTMHMYMASILQHHNAIPNTYEPLLAIPQFGQYPIGFHLILAYLSMLSEMTVYRSALLLMCYVFHLLFLSLCAQFGDRSRKWPIFVAVFMVILFSHYPQFLFQWGSGTTALSLTFLFILFPIMRKVEYVNIRELPVAALLGVAALACQPLPLFGFMLYFPVYFLVMNGIPSRKALLNLVLYLTMAAFFSIGIFSRLPDLPDAYTLGRAMEWNLSQFKAVHPFIERLTGLKQLSSFDIPAVYIFILGVFTSVISFITMFFVKDKKIRVLYLAFLLVSSLILLSKIHPFLPFNYALYPERTLVFMAIPIAMMYEYILGALNGRELKGIIATAIVSFCVAYIVMGSCPYKSHYRLLKEKMISPAKFVLLSILGADYIIYATDNSHSEVVQDDLVAIDWIKGNVSKKEVIDCDYGSGGHLIPIIAGNKILRPHYSFEFYRKYLKPWQIKQNVKYYFVRSNTLLVSKESTNIRGREVFRSGNAAIYYDDGINNQQHAKY